MDELTSSSSVGPHTQRHAFSLRGLEDLVDLRHLKILSVVAPAAFILAVEGLWFVLDSDHALLPVSVHLALAAGSVLAVAAFAALMFHFIDRAQDQLQRQNRELAAANAVATAVRGERSVAGIAEGALHCMLGVSGAAEAAIELTGAYAGAPDHLGPSVSRWDAVSEDLLDSSGPAVELPLSSSTSPVGVMTLRLPGGASERDCLAPRTRRNIGLQIGSAIQIAHLIEDMERRKLEGHGFYDVLMRISNQNPLPEILTAVAGHARDLLHADEAAVCLHDGGRYGGQACLTASGGETRHLHGRISDCPSRSSHRWAATLAVPVGSISEPQGEVWIGRHAGDQFGERDRGFLEALSGLAAIAVTAARVRESESQHAVLVERDRIAREMHDSLAQVLGVAHLQLRVLDTRAAVRADPELAAALAQLADMCEEAYHDVREAILGLRESSRVDRGLLANLRVYVDKYSQQCGIEATLDSSLDHALALPPPTEVQVIRVIQEALTNVRKHARARLVSVRIDEDARVTTFTVEDDGCGFDPGAHPSDHDGYGMSTMSERIRALGGTLTVDSAPGRGTRVVATVPTSAPVDGFAEVAGGHG